MNNFGDGLNPWIWSQLMPDLGVRHGPMHGDVLKAGSYICSIGSFLSTEFLSRFGDTCRLIVAGSGAGYGQSVHRFTLGRHFPRTSHPRRGSENIGHQFPGVTVAWVRGPLTAARMQLDERSAIADGAYLLRLVAPVAQDQPVERGQVAFMPHIASADLVPWRRACETLGWAYVDPRADRTEVLSLIGAARLLVTEALHGAITADALRTPWVAVRSSREILDFKWLDHCASIGVAYQPVDLRTPWEVSGVASTQRHPLKRVAYFTRAWMANWTRSLPTLAREMKVAAAQPPTLSEDETIRRIDARLHERVEHVKVLAAQAVAAA